MGGTALTRPANPRRICPVTHLTNGFLGPALDFTATKLRFVTRTTSKSVIVPRAVTTTSEPEAEAETPVEEIAQEEAQEPELPPVPKAKKRKGLKHIMGILNKTAVEAASEGKSFPDIRTGDIVQLRVEVLENKKRVSLYRGIVIAKHNAGINSTFRIRRVIAGVGVEMVFPLYSPNVKEIKVVNRRKVRRAKLYYLRHKIARLSSV